MKHILIIFIILTSSIITGQTQKTYQLNTFQSVIKWKGSYSFNFSEHNGTVYFSSGKLITSEGMITGGSFIIDMSTITNEEYRRRKDMGPVGHLRNEDFFHVDAYPEAKLVITKVEYFSNDNTHRFTANLTIKEITQSIQFVGHANGETRQILTRFIIDRTRWGITYNNSMKNSVISDAVEFDVVLQFDPFSL